MSIWTLSKKCNSRVLSVWLEIEMRRHHLGDQKGDGGWESGGFLIWVLLSGFMNCHSSSEIATVTNTFKSSLKTYLFNLQLVVYIQHYFRLVG